MNKLHFTLYILTSLYFSYQNCIPASISNHDLIAAINKIAPKSLHNNLFPSITYLASQTTFYLFKIDLPSIFSLFGKSLPINNNKMTIKKIYELIKSIENENNKDQRLHDIQEYLSKITHHNMIIETHLEKSKIRIRQGLSNTCFESINNVFYIRQLILKNISTSSEVNQL